VEVSSESAACSRPAKPLLDLNDTQLVELRKLAKEIICPYARNNKCEWARCGSTSSPVNGGDYDAAALHGAARGLESCFWSGLGLLGLGCVR
jgi:hypothetical protein